MHASKQASKQQHNTTEQNYNNSTVTEAASRSQFTKNYETHDFD